MQEDCEGMNRRMNRKDEYAYHKMRSHPVDSNGIVHDFQGPYYVEEGRMMLGKATRYLPLDPNKVRASVEGNTAEERWDKCVEMVQYCTPGRVHSHRFYSQGAEDFRKKIHCLIYPNCNHHVAHTLNLMKYDGWNHYEMLQLWYIIFFRARHMAIYDKELDVAVARLKAMWQGNLGKLQFKAFIGKPVNQTFFLQPTCQIAV
eukprot:767029-Hanusia_phi.AAC.2